jgi:hypothetical protein
MRLRSTGLALLLSVPALFLTAFDPARADVHTVKIVEVYTQCDNGGTDVQYIEMRSVGNQFFRQCASIQVMRTVGGPNVFFAKPVFVGHLNDEVFPSFGTFLIATPAFQAATGIVPDLLMPNGTLDPAGSVIRFAADSGCEPNANWGTIQEVRYGDTGTVPAPGPHQTIIFNTTFSTWSVSNNRTPKNYANQTTSTWTCDLSAPQVSVTLPNGGESWPVGSQQDIHWAATDDGIVTGVRLEYSTNAGSSWNLIAASEPNDNSYSWVVPNTPTSQALVKITATDFTLKTGADSSDAVFSIFVPSEPDTVPPVVEVVQPNGGEAWVQGNSEAILWSATDTAGVTSVDLDYSTDRGANWKSIAIGETNDGAYDWLVPEDPSLDSALVRVTAHDAALNSGSDQSDAPFTIHALSSVPGGPGVVTRPMLLQNRPNPFHPGTTIGMALPAAATVTLRVYAIDGRLVRTLLSGESRAAGTSQVAWDGRDDRGRMMPSGTYFYSFEAGAVREVRRMTLSK